MGKPVTFFVDGVPKGQPRPRAFVRGNRAAVYDPGTAEGWKSCVAIAAKEHLPPERSAEPVKLALQFWMPRPKSHYHTGKKAGILREDAVKLHTGKPDADNLAKAVLDAMTALGFWQDDSQVWHLDVSKYYSERPGCHVKVIWGQP